ncbi:hypothetical protein [Streptomyces cyaneofuscatus]|uniref:hypothetical protein n=1 Tax=Streptomyces cyaneofuscatus TaxID=66883 RepID=UPI0034231938
MRDFAAVHYVDPVMSTIQADVSYQHDHYSVQFLGQVRSAGTHHYFIEGEFNARGAAGALTAQSVSLGYRGESGKWCYKSFYISEMPQELKIYAERDVREEKVQIQVGATSQIANLYEWGPREEFDIGM